MLSDLDRGNQCVIWAEEHRDKYYEGVARAERGEDPLCRGSDDLSRAFQFRSSNMAKDMIGLEQMYRAWAMMYFAQFEAKVTAGRLAVAGMRAIPTPRLRVTLTEKRTR
jgi:hypothetical protein